MRHELAQTKNVMRFLAAVNDLTNRPMGVEGMGLLYGRPGEGKSTVTAYAVNQLGGVYLRARRSWTESSMLEALMRELGCAPMGRRDAMVDKAIEVFSDTPRPLFVDEADYILRYPGMIDVFRDIYDLARAPVVLIGMEDIARVITSQKRYDRFRRRITQWVEFAGVDLEDARILADTVCEVGVSDDLVEHLHAKTKANVGLMVVGLSRIESLGRTSRLERVDRRTWGKRELFCGEPSFQAGA